MPKKSSTKTETELVTPSIITASTVETSTVPTEKKQRKPKATKVETATTSVSEVLVSTPVVETVVTASSSIVPAVVSDVDTEAVFAEKSIEFLAKLQQIGTLISSLKAEYRVLEKQWHRELKVAQKVSSKRKRKAGNRAPSGFVKPTRISDELAKFLDKPTGSEMARTVVTKEINTYIRNHNLQDKENGRKINPDVKLAALLKLKKSDELTYFNLQKYMSPHFAKATKDVVTA
jgi:upstream activation factor subunit UAF30